MKEKAGLVVWKNASRKEHFMLVSHESLSPGRRKELENEGVAGVELKQLL
ncbi:MAG: hypothetical protein H7Y05_01685 [Steroidobacteraceae bacterium]|nr:hypothetical protein [Deltaproteobacteria bacterium]